MEKIKKLIFFFFFFIHLYSHFKVLDPVRVQRAGTKHDTEAGVKWVDWTFYFLMNEISQHKILRGQKVKTEGLEDS